MVVEQKYLAQYAESEAKALAGKLNVEFERAFVLPIFNETTTMLEPFLAIEREQKLLSVWVFNCPENASRHAIQSTQSALAYFKDRCSAKLVGDGVLLAQLSDKHTLLLVDRCGEGRYINPKQGVGLARKIGADVVLAASISDKQSAARAPFWIHFCDADVTIPEGYFGALKAPPETSESAALYSFRHCAREGLELACQLYDFKLHYYLEQLRWAGSLYAYHALGSIMAVSSRRYAQVRGVPKRSGGEDFYLLNKLAKLGKFRKLDAPVLKVQARDSDRVPFGTGPAISNINAMRNPIEEYRYYHPQIFHALKEVLRVSQDVEWSNVNLENLSAQFSSLDEDVCSKVVSTLDQLGIEKFVKHCNKQAIMGAKASRAFDEWFDAFVTLRFVHIMRDQLFASLPLDALADAGASVSNSMEEIRASILG